MIVAGSAFRSARRTRRIPSLASIVRAIGSVQVFDSPPAWCACSGHAGPHQSFAP